MDEAAPTADELAAALAAIALYLADVAPAHITSRLEALQSGWQHSIKLLQQQRRPAHAPIKPQWGTIERLRLA